MNLRVMTQFTSSRPSIRREPNMKLEGGERLVLKSVADLQGSSTDYVDDFRLAVATKMRVEDVRDWLETLEGKGFVERIRLTDGFSAYVTAKGKQALRLTEPIPRDELEEHLALLKRLLINFPRNRGFLGREVELARLHAALSGSGSGSSPVGIRPAGSARAAGLFGMGGIGKTQLAVEYSYRQHEAGAYPEGIYWINAAEPLNQGFAGLARYLGLARTDQALDQQVRLAFDALGRWKKALLVLDNLEDPGILNRPIVSGCIPAGLLCRLLFTTRRRDLSGFTPVEVTVLPDDSALQLLLRHPKRQPAIEPSHPGHEPAVAITRMLGRLPLALGLAGAYLGKWSDPDKPGYVSLSGYHERLRTKGRLATVDVEAKKLSHNKLRSIRKDAVEATLRQQWGALDDEDARSLLLVAGQLPEAAVIPNERLGLLAGVAVRSDDDEGPSSL